MIYNERELIDSIKEKNIENFNNNGGVNMYTYKMPSTISSADKEAVFEKFKEIDSKYSIEEYTPVERTSLGLEQKEYTAPTEDEILKEAENSLRSDRNSGLSSIDEKYSSKFSSLNDKAESALEDREDKVEDVNSDYNYSLRETKNSSIKQGIARSSIYNEALKAIEESKGEQLNSVQKEYEKNISKLESEKGILEQQKESALNGFDISYAVKLENKIANLNSAIAKEQESVLKYNNQVAEKEAAHQLTQEKAEITEKARVDKKNQELLELLSKKGVTEINRYKLQEKYNIALSYLMSIPKEDALKELQNDQSYEKQLSNYYPALYAKMLNREN